MEGLGTRFQGCLFHNDAIPHLRESSCCQEHAKANSYNEMFELFLKEIVPEAISFLWLVLSCTKCVGVSVWGNTMEIRNRAKMSAQTRKKFCSKYISGTVIKLVSLNTLSISTKYNVSPTFSHPAACQQEGNSPASMPCLQLLLEYQALFLVPFTPTPHTILGDSHCTL